LAPGQYFLTNLDVKKSNPTRRVAVLGQILDKFTGKNHIDTQFNRFKYARQFTSGKNHIDTQFNRFKYARQFTSRVTSAHTSIDTS